MTAPRPGRIAASVAAELPDLRLVWTLVAAAPGPPTAAARRRLSTLADRGRGDGVVALRSRPVPRAYRALYRQIGLDPDAERIPQEATEVRRLAEGGLPPRERIADACRIGLLEAGVPVWALDGATVAPETFGIAERAGRLVVADARAEHGALFGDPAPGSVPGPRTVRVLLYAVAAPGVPQLHAEEALWLATETLEPSRDA